MHLHEFCALQNGLMQYCIAKIIMKDSLQLAESVINWSVFEKGFLQDVRHNLWEISLG